MNKRQKAKLQTNQLFVKEAKSDDDLLSSIPAFSEAVNRLDEINNTIVDYGVKQETINTGVKVGKDNKMDVLIDWTSEFAGLMHSLAVKRGDYTLKAKVDFSASEIEHFNPSDLVTNAKIIAGLANTISPEELVYYGLSASDLIEFENALQAFAEVKSIVREVTIERVGHTTTLATLFQESNDLLLNTIDRLALQFRRKSPAYYAKLKAARNISINVTHKKKDLETGNTADNKAQ